MPIRIKRVYEPAAKSDGKRYLVDRIWPRGIRKDTLVHDAWLKELAPSSELRRWFGHDPERWTEFKKRYARELSGKSLLWEALWEQSRKMTVTLLYSARDEEHNQAVALQAYLARIKRRSTTGMKTTRK